MAAVIDSRLATLHDLQTVYGLEDMWRLYEIHGVSRYNEYLAMKRANKS